MPKNVDVSTVKDSVAKLNRDRRRIMELERQLKPYLDAKRLVATYFKQNPHVDMVFDDLEEHHCFAVRAMQTRFNPDVARERLGDAARECYESKATVSVGYGADATIGDDMF